VEFGTPAYFYARLLQLIALLFIQFRFKLLCFGNKVCLCCPWCAKRVINCQTGPFMFGILKAVSCFVSSEYCRQGVSQPQPGVSCASQKAPGQLLCMWCDFFRAVSIYHVHIYCMYWLCSFMRHLLNPTETSIYQQREKGWGKGMRVSDYSSQTGRMGAVFVGYSWRSWPVPAVTAVTDRIPVRNSLYGFDSKLLFLAGFFSKNKLRSCFNLISEKNPINPMNWKKDIYTNVIEWPQPGNQCRLKFIFLQPK
jgi:hypothetical protein